MRLAPAAGLVGIAVGAVGSVVAAQGCAETTDGDGASSSEAGGGSGTTSGTGSSNGGGASSGPIEAGVSGVTCPATLPEAGTPCAVPWACEYGSDPNCTSIAWCGRTEPQGTYTYWSISPPGSLCSGNPAACLSAFDPDAGGPCAAGTWCLFPEGFCGCGVKCVPPICQQETTGTATATTGGASSGTSSGGIGSGPVFRCPGIINLGSPACPVPIGPPIVCAVDAATVTEWQCTESYPAGCGPRPRLGTPCDGSASQAACVSQEAFQYCADGVWQSSSGGC
jgi:hypothetical protein